VFFSDQAEGRGNKVNFYFGLTEILLKVELNTITHLTM
jgi:hypothetical protein